MEIDNVYCLNCKEGTNQLKTESANLFIVDPPYGKKIAPWDTFTSMDLQNWLDEYQRILVPNGSLYFFGWPEVIASYWHEFEKRFDQCRWLTWFYRTASNINHNTWGRNQQTIVYATKGDPVFNLDAVRIPYAKTTNTKRIKHDDSSSRFGISKNQKTSDIKKYHPKGRKPMDVFTCPTVVAGVAQKEGQGHDCQKPEQLIEYLVLASSNENDLVVDPFFGSGTTGVVCKRYNRRWIGFENDPRWVQNSLQRISTTDVKISS